MGSKMVWLKDRLRAVKKTPAGLARALEVAPPRVYEMIAGRRGMQPGEIEPTAAFLEWPVEEVMSRLPVQPQVYSKRTSAGSIPVLHAEATASTSACDGRLTGEIAHHLAPMSFEGRGDIQGMYMSNALMWPWRDCGQLVVFEMERPPKESDHVVIWLAGDATFVLVRQLLASKHPGKVRVRQHNPDKTTEIDRKTIANIYRVLTWDDCMRWTERSPVPIAYSAARKIIDDFSKPTNVIRSR